MAAPRKNLEDMQRVAAARGGSCLSKAYRGHMEPLRWRCERGHQWVARPAHVNRGAWCHVCARGAITLDELQQTAHERGGECLSKRYADANTPMRFQCAKGHEWRAKPRAIRLGSWCHVCMYQRAEPDDRLKEVQAVARELGGECLSTTYTTVRARMLFRCALGHEFSTQVNRVLTQHSWCPTCARGPRIDLTKFAKTRDGRCLSPDYQTTADHLLWECSEGHQWRATLARVKRGSWCPECAHANSRPHPRGTLQQLRMLARERNGECLSKVYEGSKIKHRWRCGNSHEWEAQPNSISRGAWCPRCRGSSRYGIDELALMAEARGGRMLSKARAERARSEKLTWQCAEGHRFHSTVAAVGQGSWCPRCRQVSRTIDVAKLIAIAERRKGKLLSVRAPDLFRRLRWQCEQGHRWHASGAEVIEGAWCPECPRVRRASGRRGAA